MNPQNPSFGTGSNLLGGSAPLAANMAAGAPVMNQQSPASPSFTPGQEVNPYPPLPARNAMSILPPGPQAPQGPAPAGMAKPTAPKTEQQLIVEALGNRLKSISELEHKLHEALHPQPTGGGAK